MNIRKFLSIGVVVSAVCLTPFLASATTFDGFGARGGKFDKPVASNVKLDKTDKFGFQGDKNAPEKGHKPDMISHLLDKKHGKPGNSHGGWGGPKKGGGDVAPVPLPATLPLLLGGIGVIGAIQGRRKS